MPLRASEFRGEIYFRLLSKVDPASRQRYMEQLDALYDHAEREKGFAIKPYGRSYVTEVRDMLLCLHRGKVVAAVSIEIAPRIDGLVLDPDSEWPQIRFDQLTSRAEGMLLARGHEWYDVTMPRDSDERYIKKIAGAESTRETLDRESLLTFRRFL